MTTTSSPLDERAAGARRFVDRVSIVTGAGQGIGAATARRLGAEGAIVVIADLSEAGAQRTRDMLEDHGVQTMVFLGDLSEWDTCHRLMDETLERFGRIDVLVNNLEDPTARSICGSSPRSRCTRTCAAISGLPCSACTRTHAHGRC